MAPLEAIHLLRANGSASAPFATETLCGLRCEDDGVSAVWPGEKLRGVHWGKPYRINGRWCPSCRKTEKEES